MIFTVFHIFFSIFFKFISFVPFRYLNKSFNFNNNYKKWIDLNGIVQYDLTYTGQDLSLFFLTLLVNLSEIYNEIYDRFKTDKVLGIVCSVIIINSDINTQYYRSLSDTNRQLYNIQNFSEWPKDLFFNFLRVLETYYSFTGITISIHIVPISVK